MTRRRLYNYYLIHKNAEGYDSIYDCYKKPSILKLNAFKYCEEKARVFGGELNALILTYNQQIFTYGFTHYIKGVKYFTVITKSGLNTQEVSKLNDYGYFLVHKNRKDLV